MRWRLFRMGIEGKVAFANLGLVGLALAAFLIAFPDGVVHHDSTSEGMLAFASILQVMLAVLSFPVGWLSFLLDGMHGLGVTAVIFVPLNAYLWGYIVAAVVKWRKSRPQGASSADDTSIRS